MIEKNSFTFCLFISLAACLTPQKDQAGEFAIPFTAGDNLGELPATRNGEPICVLSRRAINYVGNSGESLADCLLKYENADTLYITSYGGGVDASINSSKIIEARKMEIHILGYCASSCANYIMPASPRIQMHYPSVVLLHGSPPTDVPAMRRIVEAAYEERSDLTDEERQVKIERALENVSRTAQIHLEFVREHNIGPVWYSLEGIGDKEKPKTELGVLASFVKKCLPSSTVIIDKPMDLEGLAFISRYVHGPIDVVGMAIVEPETCG